MLTVHGDAVGPGELFLRADGPPEAVKVAAEMLGTLTPHFVPDRERGGVGCPLTWPAVVQLSYLFGGAWRPSPALQAWVQEQAMLRMMPPATEYVAPAGLTPYAHQFDGAALIKATGKVLVTDEPGTGKTITALLGLSERLLDHWKGLGP